MYTLIVFLKKLFGMYKFESCKGDCPANMNLKLALWEVRPGQNVFGIWEEHNKLDNKTTLHRKVSVNFGKYISTPDIADKMYDYSAGMYFGEPNDSYSRIWVGFEIV